MFLESLDKIDRKIIEELIKNARISYSELGKKLGISRVAAKMRVANLEKAGIIEEYTTIINPQKISGAISCYFEIELSPATFPEAIMILENNEDITQIYRVTGQNKLHVHAVLKDNEALDRLLGDVMDQLPGLIALSTNIIMTRIKDIKGLRL